MFPNGPHGCQHGGRINLGRRSSRPDLRRATGSGTGASHRYAIMKCLVRTPHEVTERPTPGNPVQRAVPGPLLLPRRLAQAALVKSQGRRWFRAAGRRITRRTVITRATEKDIAVIRRHFDPPSSRLFSPRDAETVVWVAKYRSHILGCTNTVHERDESSPWYGYWLKDLWVRPRYRGLGVGERLTRHGLEHAGLEGAPHVLVLVSEENELSIRLHQKLGFEMVTIPALEPTLILEFNAVGKRHFAMRRALTGSEWSPNSGPGLRAA